MNEIEKRLLHFSNLLAKGWEVSLLALLAFLQQRFSLSLFQVGLLSSGFVLFQIIATLFSGNLSERVGKRSVFALSTLSFSLAWLIIVFSKDVTFLFLSYGLGGIGAGFFDPMANSSIARGAYVNKRGQELASFGVFGDVGRIGVVALVTTIVGVVGVSAAAFMCFVISFLVLASFLLIKTEFSAVIKEVSDQQSIKEYLGNAGFRWALLAGVLDSFGSSSLYIFIPFLLLSKGIDLSISGFFTALFFAGYLGGRVLLGRAADRWGTARTLIYSELAMAVLILVLILGQNAFLILINLFLLGAFARGTSPVVRVMVAEAIGDKKGFDKAYSLYSFSTRTTLVPCRPIFGFLSQTFGVASVFSLSAVVVLATIIPAVKFKRELSRTASQNFF